MSLHSYPTRVDEYDSEDEIYHRSPYHSPGSQRRHFLQKPPMRYNPGYYDPSDEDDLSLPMRGMNLDDYPPRWTPPFFDEPHPGYMQRPYFLPEEEYPYFPDPVGPQPQYWAPPPADLRFQGDRLSDNEMARGMPFLRRSLSSRSHRQDRPNQRMPIPPRRFQDLNADSEDEDESVAPPPFRRFSTGSRNSMGGRRRRRRTNSLSAMPPLSRNNDRMGPPGTPFHPSEEEVSEEEEMPPLRGLNRRHSYGNFPPPPPMQPNGPPPVILPQPMPVESGPPMGPPPPPNPMYVPQPGDYFEPMMNNTQEGTGPSTPSANDATNAQNANTNIPPPPPHMGQWMGPPPVFPNSPGGNNPMFNQQNMMGMGMPMVNMFNNPMMPPLWGFPPMSFMSGSSEPTLVNPESTSPHRPVDKENPRPEPSSHDMPDMQAPPPPPMMKPESSRRRFSIFNLFGKKNEYHYEPMQPFPEDQFRGVPMPPPGGFSGPFSAPIQDRSSKERKKIEQYEKLGTVWAWRIAQDPDNIENIQHFCQNVDPNRYYSFNINNQKLIKKKELKYEIMLGNEKLLNGNLMIRPSTAEGFFIPRNSPIRNDPIVIRLDLIRQNFSRGEIGNGFVFNNHR